MSSLRYALGSCLFATLLVSPAPGGDALKLSTPNFDYSDGRKVWGNSHYQSTSIMGEFMTEAARDAWREAARREYDAHNAVYLAKKKAARQTQLENRFAKDVESIIWEMSTSLIYLKKYPAFYIKKYKTPEVIGNKYMTRYNKKMDKLKVDLFGLKATASASVVESENKYTKYSDAWKKAYEEYFDATVKKAEKAFKKK